MANETVVNMNSKTDPALESPETLVGRYFRDVSHHGLLTEESEKRLSARLIRCFGWLARQQPESVPPPATIREAQALFEQIERPSRLSRRAMVLVRGSRERLIRSNLRLAVHIARRYTVVAGPVISDLIQDANVGLIKAVDRFDPARGFRFSTYAYWWITEEVRRSLKRGHRVIHTPDHIIDEIRSLHATTLRLHNELERMPRQSELARELEISPARISEIRGFAATELSTEMPITDESGISLGDTLVSDSQGPDQRLAGRDRRRVLERLLKHLSEREQDVLSRRFGLDRSSEETLQVISDALGISRERVRQIEKTALKKLQQLCLHRGEAEPSATAETQEQRLS